MALLDLLGRRWALRVGWELRAGALPFRELQRRCGMISPNVLAARLREGVESGTIEKGDDGSYHLTARGRELAGLLVPLDAWAKKWAKERGTWTR
jgi:DNA-binding HxlR family transcriptional regulator